MAEICAAPKDLKDLSVVVPFMSPINLPEN